MSDTTSNGNRPPESESGAARATRAIMREAVRPLPKRFYKDVSVAELSGEFAVLLDGRRIKSPRKHEFKLPTRPLAEAVAGEWAAQAETIDPAKMPLTTLTFTAIDAVTGQEEAVAAEIVKYAGSDLLCYRAEAPAELVTKQARHWDPVLLWAEKSLGARFVVATGLMPIEQPPDASKALARAIAGLPALELAALHVLTTLTGSALLAIAVQRAHLSLDEAWAAAHVDEDWQVSLWGEDAEALQRRADRLIEARAAAQILAAEPLAA